MSYFFSKIPYLKEKFDKRHNDTKEKLLEFEFYNLLDGLLEFIETFETGIRKTDFTGDYKDFIKKLESGVDTLKTNLKSLESLESE